MQPRSSEVEISSALQWVPCDFCGSSRREHLFSGPDRLLGLPEQFSFVRCRDCGLLYQSPRLPWEQLAAYYQDDYTSYARLLREESSLLRRASKRYGFIKQRRYVERFQRQGHLLDVGCGTGLFLEEMQRVGRWDLSGLEPTHQAAVYARECLGIPVVEQIFEAADLLPGRLDVITLWHVLEHMSSPMQALRKAWTLLRPGGHLIFSIPNHESLGRRVFGRFWVGWDLPRHLYVFPRPVLGRMLEKSGFRVLDNRCFLISYFALGQSLSFWFRDWPAGRQGLARLLSRLYYSPPARLGIFPLQVLVEWLGLASVTAWAVQKVEAEAAG